MYAAAAADLGLAWVRTGNAKAGVELLEDALRREMYRHGGRYTEFFLLQAYGSALYLSGRLDDARRIAARALVLTQSTGEAGHEACVLKLIADISAADGAPAHDVAQAYEAARARAASLSMAPLAASCLVGAAGTLDKSGVADAIRTRRA